VIRFIERSLIYPAPSRKRGDWQPRWLDKEDVWFPSVDGTKLHGWFVPHPEPRHVIVYSHGNGEHVGDQVNVVLRLQATLSASVFVYDYRGYGQSKGRPTEAGLITDGLAAQQCLAERVGMLPQDLVLMGRSLGGGVSIAVAAERGARAVIVEATFSRMIDAARYNYPWLPVRLFMRDRYDSISRLGKYNGPFFQSHGSLDEVVPIQLARRLFDSAPTRQKQFYEIVGARHNEPQPLGYYNALDRFLEQVAEDNPKPLLSPVLLGEALEAAMPLQAS
jgi:fermentation-respiration switch protein FrsA (DUF1100 family)